MILSPRLKAIAQLVPTAHTLADIGTDHGYIPLYLIEQKRIKHAIAADISAGSLDKARQLARQHQLEHCIETRLGNGLSVLTPGETDIIVIAGMGGILISDIIEQNQETARSADALILQPMIGQAELRRWLLQNGYDISDEELVKEGHRIYEIIVAVPDRAGSGCEADSVYEKEIFYDIGWKLIEKRHPLLKERTMKKIRSLEETMAQLREGKTDTAAVKLQQLEEKLKQYKEVYNCHIR